MPIYEYRCSKCGERFETIHSIRTRPAEVRCPACGTTSPERQPSVFAAPVSCGSSGGFG